MQDKTYLGPYAHPSKLQVNDTQVMQFTETDIGPFYLSTEKREATKFDVESDVIEKKKYKKEQMIRNIIDASPLTKPKGTIKEIQAIAE